jgi:putative two-component system protein, hydrogenase maturation factor HypX/HoxX
VRVLLLCSAFNGLSQRAWIELTETGHDVRVQLATSDDSVVRAVAEYDPDLVICPFLRERVPAEVWANRRTIIIHPGPVGDRGPSSLDWAIGEGTPEWGVTALQAVEAMDAGPIWGTRTFPIDPVPQRKSRLYNQEVADAATELVRDVVLHAADPAFVPRPVDYSNPDVQGRPRPVMRQADRAFSWSDPSEQILRRVRAADGSPGLRTTLCGLPVSIFDVHPGPAGRGEPGTVVARRHGAVLVRTGDGTIWVGQARRVPSDGEQFLKLPAVSALAPELGDVPEHLVPLADSKPGVGYPEITYRRAGAVGVVRFDFYNGAMSTRQCRRLALALRHAAAQDTKVLVVAGGEFFSNGIHLNVIEAAADPAAEAWRNINAIDDVCREIINCHQLVVAAVAGNAGAGGVMMALGADRVLLRQGVVLNPCYHTMGLYGSEYWTYVLPRRIGQWAARELTDCGLPVGATEAVRIGLADHALPGRPDEFHAAVMDHAARLATDSTPLLAAKHAARRTDEQQRPLLAYRVAELAEMSRDIFDDRSGFTASRRAFVHHQPAPTRPPRVDTARSRGKLLGSVTHAETGIDLRQHPTVER